MTVTITMTSKGQFTLPAEVRKAMALRKQGDKLVLDFSPSKQQATLSKPVSLDAIQTKAKSYVRPGTEPLVDAGALYETREPRL
jgi:bifunctional DNA-binding transcriptional regulator/antitoxin component of YhaV-PrlF toxin-antitoxin module